MYDDLKEFRLAFRLCCNGQPVGEKICRDVKLAPRQKKAAKNGPDCARAQTTTDGESKRQRKLPSDVKIADEVPHAGSPAGGASTDVERQRGLPSDVKIKDEVLGACTPADGASTDIKRRRELSAEVKIKDKVSPAGDASTVAQRRHRPYFDVDMTAEDKDEVRA